MAEVNSLLNTDASNTTRFNGANNVSTLDDAGRALEGMLSRWIKDNDGSNTTAGTATAFVISLNRTGLAANAEVDRICVRFHLANSGAATLQCNSLAALPLRKAGNAALVTGDILANDVKDIVFNPANNTFQLLGQ